MAGPDLSAIVRPLQSTRCPPTWPPSATDGDVGFLRRGLPPMWDEVLARRPDAWPLPPMPGGAPRPRPPTGTCAPRAARRRGHRTPVRPPKERRRLGDRRGALPPGPGRQACQPRNGTGRRPCSALLEVERAAQTCSVVGIARTHAVALHVVKRTWCHHSNVQFPDTHPLHVQIGKANGIAEPADDVDGEGNAGRPVLDRGVVPVQIRRRDLLDGGVVVERVQRATKTRDVVLVGRRGRDPDLWCRGPDRERPWRGRRRWRTAPPRARVPRARPARPGDP